MLNQSPPATITETLVSRTQTEDISFFDKLNAPPVKKEPPNRHVRRAQGAAERQYQAWAPRIQQAVRVVLQRHKLDSVELVTEIMHEVRRS